MTVPFKVLTESEIGELSRRGRAILSQSEEKTIFIGQVILERFLGIDYEASWLGHDCCMAIYWDHGLGLYDCHMENEVGHLLAEGEDFAARRALKTLRAHMVLDDLASA